MWRSGCASTLLFLAPTPRCTMVPCRPCLQPKKAGRKNGDVKNGDVGRETDQKPVENSLPQWIAPTKSLNCSFTTKLVFPKSFKSRNSGQDGAWNTEAEEETKETNKRRTQRRRQSTTGEFRSRIEFPPRSPMSGSKMHVTSTHVHIYLLVPIDYPVHVFTSPVDRQPTKNS